MRAGRLTVAPLALVLLLAACGSATSAPDGRASDDATAKADGPLDCAAAVGLPPIIAAVNARTSAQICPPDFTVLQWPDAGAGGPLDGMPYFCGLSTDYDCPGPPKPGRITPCAYALLALTGNGTVTTYQIEISKPGFLPASISVMSGLGGCGPHVFATHALVPLLPDDRDASASH